MVAIVLVWAAIHTRVNRAALSAAPASQSTEIQAPADWVPFRAKIEKSRTGTPAVTVGLYFRADDGSTRTEFDVPRQELRNVTIMNVSNRTYYESRGPVWCSHPMRISPDGWRPKRMREENPNLARDSRTVESFRVRQVNSRGRVTLVAPALNFFGLVVDNPATGARTRYYDVTVGDQNPAMFVPPPNVTVLAHALPMGIITDGTIPPTPAEIRAEHR
jgi:hypothetical protein